MRERPRERGLLDDPGQYRQWLLRRLQQSLTRDLAFAAFAGGLAATNRDEVVLARTVLREVDGRVPVLRQLITDLGSTPYSSIGLARACAYGGGRVLGVLGSWSWAPIARRVVVDSLPEYDALLAFARSDSDSNPTIAERAEALMESARRLHELFERSA